MTDPMTEPQTMPLCRVCTRLHTERIPHKDDPCSTSTCDAFPGGIPEGIYCLAGDHRLPWPGDHGIRFELVDGKQLPVTFRARKGAQP